MDGIARSRRLLLTGILLLAACAGEEALGPVGSSMPRAPEAKPRAEDAAVPLASPVPADFRRRMTRASDRFLSRGHGERFDATVWVDAPDGGSPAGPFADGTTLVEDLGAPDGGAKAAGVLVMERRGGVWRFVAVGPEGEVADDAGAQSCEPCHREAAEGVFPWPSARP